MSGQYHGTCVPSHLFAMRQAMIRRLSVLIIFASFLAGMFSPMLAAASEVGPSPSGPVLSSACVDCGCHMPCSESSHHCIRLGGCVSPVSPPLLCESAELGQITETIERLALSDVRPGHDLKPDIRPPIISG